MSDNAGSAGFIFAIFFFFVSLSGCSSSSSKPTSFHIYSEADAELNRDNSESPLSVVLYVYQLKDRQAFSRLTFEDFLSGKTDADLLGEDLINKTEQVMLPGAKESVTSGLLPEAKYVGVVAMYRLPAPQQWRYLIPAEQIRKKGFFSLSKQKNIAVRLHDCHMTIDGVELDLIPGQRSDSSAVCAGQTPSATTAPSSPAQITENLPR